MKKILIFLLLIISTNLFGQIKQEVIKPINHKFGVYYLDDQSVMFNTNGLIFKGGDVPQLIDIFRTADSLNKFCRKNVDIQVSVLIDTLDGYQFVFGYAPSKKFSGIGIVCGNKPCNIYVYNFNGMTFTSYLTTYRIEYYGKLEIYNYKVAEAKSKLNLIVRKK
jgi:hypothetical protein